MAKDHMCVSLVPLFNHLDETDQRVIHMLVTHHIKEKRGTDIYPNQC